MVNQMAYVNVAEWSPEHVSEWLRGLEYSLLPYVQFFLNNGIDGHHLLNLTANDLEDLHIFKIGHQQLILEAVELLRQLHYSLNSETLQSLAVKLSCRARSLHNDLKINGPRDHSGNIRQERISTNLLSSVSEVLTSVKTLVSWLDRPPFQQDPVCIKLRKTVLKLSIELASTTQRDQFAELPHVLIKKNSACIAELCDQFIQTSMDSLILQPASLDFAMIKKRIDEELGIHIKSTYSGVHIIGGIKDQSPAKSCNKVESGDEIVQVNYQTVIGWQQKKLVTTMTEHSSELQLTLKKRPRHLNLLGEVIIMRPYRIPSKKTAKQCYNWPDDRHQLSVPEINPKSEGHGFSRNKCQEEDVDDSAFLPTSSSELILTKELLFQSRCGGNTAAAVQRRATVSGAYPIILQKSPFTIEELVNGIFYAKSTKNFSQGISQDLSIKNMKSEAISMLNYKHKGVQNVSNETDFGKKFPGIQKILNSNESSVLHFSSSSNDSPNVITNVKEKSSAFNTVTILEDCFANEKKNVCDTISSKSNFCLRTDIPLDLTDSVRIPKDSLRKSNSKLQKWDGIVTQFHGRKSNAHDISDEIAGNSEGNPVILRKASKLESRENLEEKSCNQLEDINSYQVVIVGGVPHKSIPVIKGEKKKSFDLLINPHKMKKKLSEGHRSRYISCSDVGQGDCAGWLYKQKEKKGFFPTTYHWVKRWIVLKDRYLYCYKDKSDNIAECFISLPGSIVSLTSEYKSKKFVFKISQEQINFYLASESQKDLTIWMNKVRLAAIAAINVDTISFFNTDGMLGIPNNFYSDTDDSESGSPTMTSHKFKNYCGNNVQSNVNLSSNESSALSLSKRFHNSVDSIIINSPKLPSVNKLPKNVTKEEEINFLIKSALTTLPRQQDNLNRKQISEQRRMHGDTSMSCAVSFTELNNADNCPKTFSNRNSFNCDYQNETSFSLPNWKSKKCQMSQPLAKEIVAKVAVSYTNVSKKNTLAIKSNLLNAPGYVSKISDSFNHLSVMSNCHELSYSREEFPNTEKRRYVRKSCICKRSASESQVTNTSTNSNHYLKQPLSAATSTNSLELLSQLDISNEGESFYNFLDKEYNKVFERSQIHFESSTNQRDRKFLPNDCLAEKCYSLTVNQNNSNFNTSGNFTESAGVNNFENKMNKIVSLPDKKMTSESCISSTRFSEDTFYPYPCDRIKNIGFTLKDSDNLILSHSLNTAEFEEFNNPICSNELDHLNRNLHSEETISDIESSKISFKFFNSPKFIKRLTSPKLDKKNMFKNMKQLKEQNQLTQYKCGKKIVETKFLSPKSEIKTVSSGVQTNLYNNSKINYELSNNVQLGDCILSLSTLPNLECCKKIKISRKSLTSSSLSRNTSNCLPQFVNSEYSSQKKTEPQTHLVSDQCKMFSLTPPRMGIAMLNKKRLPSANCKYFQSSMKCSHTVPPEVDSNN